MSASQELAGSDVARILEDWGQACRPMQEIDLDEVDAVERLIYPFPWTRGNFADSLRSGYEAWVVRDGARLRGYFVSMMVLDEAHLLNISIAPDVHGRGLGRKLLAWFELRAAIAGARSLLLEVRPSNGRAKTMYERAGYANIGVRRGYYPAARGREDAIVMRKQLDDATGGGHHGN
ncbi:ribosomal-protein-alanine N-acetyltransferase [Pigmentiphaga humi]|uniref:[Ribosomal protein bS18]-alanine N-acetyltransferase n=1 Tax=Pigmentiphaga humi TaxID=2478468 RepID=A0A3P4B9T1_9BURK|nr:ribosomal protein S18-alanine N-acetyltransferase [Pigmentiphaga humi]VCU72286.1 ribosomal-protein-alanine N-acetyltransferase [Pigmentiphaga humi]